MVNVRILGGTGKHEEKHAGKFGKWSVSTSRTMSESRSTTCDYFYRIPNTRSARLSMIRGRLGRGRGILPILCVVAPGQNIESIFSVPAESKMYVEW